jgi:hypothetical protein
VDIRRKLETYLPPDPKEKPAFTDLAVIGIGLALVLVGTVFVAYLLYRDARSSARHPVAPEDWRISYLVEHYSECSREFLVGANCVASPTNSTLWQSSMVRGSAEFLDVFRARNGDSFWMGVVIPSHQLKEAAKSSAAVLILPKINGTTSVWMDGVFQMNHQFITQGLPAQVQIPRARLTEDRPLYVAILVAPYPHYSAPDVRTASARTEGFFTAVDADRLMGWKLFYGITSHLIALGFILLLAGILWVASARNRIAYDYVVGRQFALLLALISLGSMDISSRMVTVPNLYRIQFVFMILEAVFVLRMTGSILRFTRQFSGRVALGVCMATVLMVALTPWTWIETKGLDFAVSVLLPFVYGLSAFLIGSRVLEMRRMRVGASRERMRFLYISGFTFASTALAYIVESSMLHGLEVQWSRSLNLVTIFFLVRMFFKNRRSRVFFTDSLPLSEYHRRAEPPVLNGWLVSVQLGSPESWLRTRHGQRPGRFAEQNIWSHVFTAMQAFGATVVRRSDRGAEFFFVGDASRVVEALNGFERSIRAICECILLDTDEGVRHPVLCLRAAVVSGALRPSWISGNGSAEGHQPAWESVGTTDLFHSAADLLSEIESAEAGDDKPTVVVREQDSTAFRSLSARIRLVVRQVSPTKSVG